MRSLRLLFSALFASLALAVVLLARADDVGEYELKAAYLYKFSQFTSWPEESFGESFEEFRICVLGPNPFGGEIWKLQEKKRREVAVKIALLSTVREAKRCQVAYLNPSSEAELANWVGSLASLPILTVSDFPNAFGLNVGIALTTEPNRVSFRINNGYVRAGGLRFSALLLQLAREVR